MLYQGWSNIDVQSRLITKHRGSDCQEVNLRTSIQ